MMVFVGDLFYLRQIHQLGERFEMEHRFVMAVIAEKGHILAKIHILEMICDKTPVATLDALTELLDHLCRVFHLFYNSAARRLDKVNQKVDLGNIADLSFDPIEGLRRIQLCV